MKEKICINLLTILFLFITHNIFCQNDSTNKIRFKHINYGIEAGTIFIPKLKAEKKFTRSYPSLGLNINLNFNYNFNKNFSIFYQIGYYEGKYRFKTYEKYMYFDANSNTSKETFGLYNNELKFYAYTSALGIEAQKKIKENLVGYIKIGLQIDLITRYADLLTFTNDSMAVELSYKRDKMHLQEFTSWFNNTNFNGVRAFPLISSSVGINWFFYQIPITTSLGCIYGYRGIYWSTQPCCLGKIYENNPYINLLIGIKI